MPAAGHERALVWSRRDLRSHDHAALYQARKTNRAVYCVFVFGTDIHGLVKRAPAGADSARVTRPGA
jgi:deoxyribodipyrimidine photo-lyase